MTSTTAPPEVGEGRHGDLAGTGRSGDLVFARLSSGAGVLVIALVTAVGVFLLSQALPALHKNQANFLTDRVWQVGTDPQRFGIPDLLWVTVVSSVLAMAIAVPVALGVALYLTQYAPRPLARTFGSLVDLLAAVPSIVYGLWGYNAFRGYVAPVQGFLEDRLGWIPLFRHETVTGTVFLASIVLAVMVLPVVTALAREIFDQTPATHKEAALALGATRWEMIRTAVLPFGKAGVISASMLGLGRALGETIAVTIIVSKVTGNFSWSLFSGGETFASKIANNASEFDSPDKAGAFIAAGLVLFVLTFAVNAVARVIIERRKAFIE